MPSELAKRQIVRRTKRTTTGCVTCRTRHVKCDERKPTCKNCEILGRVCQGYVTGRLSRQPARKAQETNIPLFGLVKPQTTLMPRGVSSKVLESAQEFSNLEFFTFWIDIKFCEAFGSRLWDLLVLQASQTEPVIKHLVMALTTILRQYYESQSFTISGIFGASAIMHYNKAIYHAHDLLSNASSRQQVNVGLIACLLFVCFDNLVGNYSMAQGHLQSGAKILLERHRNTQVQLSKKTTNRLLRADSVPPNLHDECEPVIEGMFERLDLQDVSRFKPAAAPPEMTLQLLQDFMPAWPPAEFKYLREARERLLDFTVSAFRIYNAVLAIRMKEPFSPRHPLHAVLKPIQLHYIDCLERWLVAFDAFLDDDHTPGQGPELHQGKPPWAHLLLLYHMMATLTVKTCLAEAETAWDSHMNSFRRMVELARIVIVQASSEQASSSPPSAKSRPKFTHILSFEFGPIFPMSIIAFKCRDPIIRKDVIRLLKTHPRREGVLSSNCIVELAEIISQYELKGAPDSSKVSNAEDIPDSARIVATWNSAWDSVDDGTGIWFLQKNASGLLQWVRTGQTLTRKNQTFM